jgi:VCBS repeat-containing protein
LALDAAQTGITSLLATDIKIGEDDQTKIDFEDADTINFYAGNEKQLILTDGALTPGSNGIVNLGTDALEFGDAFFDGTLEADAITVNGSTLASVIQGTTVTTAQNATNSCKLNVADNESTDENDLIPFIADAGSTGNVAMESDGDFHYNPSTGRVTATELAGTLQTAAQPNVTSVGTLGSLTVDNITLDSSSITNTGDLTIDVEGDICLDANGGDICLLDDGTAFGRLFKSSNDLFIKNPISNGDIKFQVNDGGSGITAFQIDASDAGAAQFNNDLTVQGDLIVKGDVTCKETVVTVTSALSVINTGTGPALTIQQDGSQPIAHFIDKNGDDIIFADDGKVCIGNSKLVLNGTAVDSTAAELNQIYNITDGTVAASKAVIVDTNKDITGFRNVTLTGELDAATLDVSGNVDIDGNLDVDGTTNLDAVDIDGAVQIDSTVTVGVDDTGYDVKFYGDTASAYMLWDASIDDLVLGGAAGLCVSGDADIDGTLEADAITVGGATLASVIQGTTVTTAQNATNSCNLNIADNESTNEDDLIPFIADAGSTGNVCLESDGDFHYNPSTGKLTATQLAGTLQTAAQTNITSLGTLTTLTVDHITIDGSTISDASDLTIDVGGDIILDAEDNDIVFKDAGSSFGKITNNSQDLEIHASTNDKDIVFKGFDNGSGITALTLDMSDAGSAIFNDKVCIPASKLVLNGTTVTSTAVQLNALSSVTFDVQTQLQAISSNCVGFVTSVAGGTGLTSTGGATPSLSVDAAQTGITSILATDLKVGEDDQTKIDFETADEIHFYAANAEQVYVADGIFGPQTDSDVDLGSSSVRWKAGYLDSITVGNNSTLNDVSVGNLDVETGLFCVKTATDASSSSTGAARFLGGVGIAKKLYVGTDLDVDGTANLDTVDIDGNTQIDGTVTVGVDDTGYDVKFFGDTASAYMLWDASVDDLILGGAAGLCVSGDADIDGTLEADAITVNGSTLASVIQGTTVTTAQNATNSCKLNIADNESTNENDLIPFIADAGSTGNVALESDGDFHYNPSTGRLTATQLAGTLQTAAQTNITSVGTLGSLTVDNITIDGSSITGTGHTTLCGGGDVILDSSNGDIKLHDDGTNWGMLRNSSTNFVICSITNDKDIIFCGVDNSSNIAALTLDMSDAGSATFNNDIITDGSICVNRLAGGTPYDNFKISTADIVTTLERVENTGDASAGYGRIDFKTNATTGGTAGRGGFKFIDGDGDSILYLENNDASATFADKVCLGDEKLVLNGTAVTATGAELNYSDGVCFNIQSQLQALSSSSSSGDITGVTAGTGLNGGGTSGSVTLNLDAAQTGITSILATDLKVGEDDQTKIDFETADEIHFYANNTEQVYVGDNIFGPQSDSDVDLGSSGVRFKDAFVDTITVTGEVDAASLDIEGDADINGTLEADAITVGGTALNTVIAGVTVTNATNAAHVCITDNESTNEENQIAFLEGATGGTANRGLEADGDFTYNPSTGTVSATIFKGNIDAVDVDVDGTLEADAITVNGTVL